MTILGYLDARARLADAFELDYETHYSFPEPPAATLMPRSTRFDNALQCVNDVSGRRASPDFERRFAMSIDRKVAVVTGASQGIGAGLVQGSSTAFQVVANSRSIEPDPRPTCSPWRATSPTRKSPTA